MGWPRPKSIVLACLVGCGLLGMVALSLRSHDPFAIKVLRVESVPDAGAIAGAQSKRVTVRLNNLGPDMVFFDKEQKVQFRAGSHWQEPTEVSTLSDLYLRPSTNYLEVVFTAPPRAEACRLVLQYRVGQRPYCRAYFFLSRHGLNQRFPKICRLALRCVSQQASLRHAELGLRISLPSAAPISPTPPR